MSEPKIDISELSILNQLKLQRAHFIQQKDLAQNNFNQLVGAIYACEVMLQKHEDEVTKQSAGDQENVETDNQAKEQVA